MTEIEPCGVTPDFRGLVGKQSVARRSQRDDVGAPEPEPKPKLGLHRNGSGNENAASGEATSSV